MNTRKILFLVACLCVSTAMHAQIRLSFNPTIGETYTTRSVSEMQMQKTIMGMSMPTNIVISLTMDMTAIEKNDKEVTLDFSYSAISLQQSSPMMNIRFSSEDDISTLSGFERDVAEVLNALVGKTTKVVLGRDGSVISIGGFDAFNNLDLSNPMMIVFQSMFNEDVLRQMLEQSFNIFPSNAVNVGDSWDNNATVIAQGVTTTSNATYTLRSVTGNSAFIDVTAVIASTGAGAEIAGESVGEMELDILTGMVINSSLNGSSSGAISGEGIEIGMEVTSRMTMTLVQ